jgi:hypothetical protein
MYICFSTESDRVPGSFRRISLQTYTVHYSHCLSSSWIIVKEDKSLISFSTTQYPLNVQRSVLLKLSAGCSFLTVSVRRSHIYKRSVDLLCTALVRILTEDTLQWGARFALFQNFKYRCLSLLIFDQTNC